MSPRSKTEMESEGRFSGISAGARYLKEIENEVIALHDGDTKFFQHGDGKGETMLSKSGNKVTAIIIRRVKGLVSRKEKQKGTIIFLNSKGVVIDGWEL